MTDRIRHRGPDDKVLVLGVAYKRNTADIRESPALRILTIARGGGCPEIRIPPPHVPRAGRGRRYDLGLASTPLTAEVLSHVDVARIVTDHAAVDYDLVVRHAPLIVDTRNATRHVVHGRGKIIKA